MTFASRNLGLLGEELAVKLLKREGYKILGRNFRSKFGEIDIIALEKNTLVFVEVKTRWSNKFGAPEEAITPWKIKRIIKAGQYYKLLYPQSPDLLRLDAVAIDLAATGEVKQIRLIRNLTG